ncbi:hypothetical protein FQN49_003440 [Arthroderma sp. PD_2]|nr:hypothetical protein FQN49_003440 [Arthroderma sp. PD_2]
MAVQRYSKPNPVILHTTITDQTSRAEDEDVPAGLRGDSHNMVEQALPDRGILFSNYPKSPSDTPCGIYEWGVELRSG